MRAIVVNKTGGPEMLTMNDRVEDPAPGQGEVVVDVEYAGINFLDTYHRSGLYELELPFTPGQEGAGTVSSVGDGVNGLAVGDRVAWPSSGASYAERKAIGVDSVVRVPDGVSSETAASLMLQGMTAHYLINDTYPVSKTDKCLIHAGAGGVGQILTQLAKRTGATVITTVGSDEKAAKSRTAGADHVVNYNDHDFVEAVEDLFGERPLDVVYDGVGASTFEGGLRLLRRRGMMVTFGNASGPVPDISPLTLGRHGSLYLTRPSLGHYIATPDELRGRATELFDLIVGGTLVIEEPTIYPLDEATQAHGDLESRRTTGKLLLRP